MKKIEKVESKLLKIAMKNSAGMRGRGTFERFGYDSGDFLEVSVWGLEDMLREAYEEGFADGKRKEKRKREKGAQC